MSQPFDGASTLLTTLSDGVRQIYHESFQDAISRFGSRTNRVLKMSKRRIDGDGINVQIKDRRLYGARTTTDINADFNRARSFSADSYKVLLSEDPAANHFRRIDLSLQVTWMDLQRVNSKKTTAFNLIEQLMQESMSNIGEHVGLRRHLDSTARIGSVNGTPKRNDNEVFASCTSIDSPTTQGSRFPVDTGSFAAFQPGMVLDRYTTTTFDGQVQVTDTNPTDRSVGVYGVNTAIDPLNGSASVNVTDIADNDDFYLSGEKDKNILSIGHWFSAPTASESFFGKDRTLPINRYLRPLFSGPSSNTLFTKAHIDNLSTDLGYIQEDPDGGYAAILQPELEQRYRDEVGNDVLLQMPVDDSTKKLYANYGFDGGSYYRHPNLGRIVLLADVFAPPGKIRFLRIGDWEQLTAPGEGGEMGWNWLGGDGATGGWYRMESSTPGNGRTTTNRMDGMMLMCDICTKPRIQAEIRNLLHGRE